MKRLRVLVVEDSTTVRRRLCEVLATDADLEVAGEVGDGQRAIELCLELGPDVVTMDMMLPTMSGLAATEYIMAYRPTPILIVSASVNRGELFRTYDALAAGAVDVLEKPRGDEPDGVWERRFLAAVKLVAKIRVITHPKARLAARAGGEAAGGGPRFGPAVSGTPRSAKVVALGASTGGPGALLEILRALPAPFPLPMLITLHLGQPFAAAFADWLDAQTGHRVRYAADGEPLAAVAGAIVLAPPDRHLVVGRGRLALTSGAERHSCRPSVDVLFESMAAELGSAAVAGLLTGMGRDGAAGLLAVRRVGGATFAQDEATSVVYGMPREAVLLGAAERVLPLGEIASALAALVAGSQEARP